MELEASMLKHADIWEAIDRLARKHNLSPSGLAKRAGLDATTFNKSKRSTRDGKLRWPSTESIAKILAATGASLSDLLNEMPNTAASVTQRIPVIGFAQAGDSGYFDDAGYPTGSGWDDIVFPDIGDPNAYALMVSGDSMEPLYRNGDRIIVSPVANIRSGDRVVVKTSEGEVMAKELVRRTAQRIELRSLNPDFENPTLPTASVEWIARILWASQ
jgi:phage repressor protein C with HTH and peptisase S24 domain